MSIQAGLSQVVKERVLEEAITSAGVVVNPSWIRQLQEAITAPSWNSKNQIRPQAGQK